MLRYEILHQYGSQDVVLHAGSQSYAASFVRGELRLLRKKVFKGSFFIPVVSTKYALLLFPNACTTEEGRSTAAASSSPPQLEGDKEFGPATVTPEAQRCIGSFLSLISHIPFSIVDAAACRFSGCAFLVLECPDIHDVLSVLEVCSEVQVQGSETRTSCLYAKGFSCADGRPTHVDLQVLSNYYYIPTCAMCGDRIECTVSGYSAETPVCTCSRNGNGNQCVCFLFSSCSVCRRFSESLEQTVQHSSPLSQQQQLQQAQHTPGSSSVIKCQACSKAGDPWICLICGYVGCSRYQAMHAKEHCMEQQHFFSMNLLTQQIWDYDGDCFVHRVVIVLDPRTGSSTRMQFPGREVPLLEDGVDAEAAEGVERPGAGDAWKAEKKNISAKYDEKLTSSHAQYAMVIKSELDAKRALYQLKLAREAGDEDDEVDDLEESAYEASGQDGAELERAQLVDLANAFEPLNSIVADASEKRRRTTALLYAVRNLEHEIGTRAEETMRLDEQLESGKKELRGVVQKNVEADLMLTSLIRDLKETLQDVALNTETGRRLQQELEGQEVSRVVVMSERGKASGSGSGTAHPKQSGPAGAKKKNEMRPPPDS